MKAILNGKIVTVTGAEIENGVLLIDGGKIIAVGDKSEVKVPADAEIIDASRCWVTPGLIDCHTHISTIPAKSSMPGPTMDLNEWSSPITPQVRAEDALYFCDEAIDFVRAAGFTTCYTGPGSTNVIAGTGFSFKLRGSTASEMIIPGSQQMKCALGENPKRIFGLKDKAPITRMGVAALFRETMYAAKEYDDAMKAYESGEKSEKPKFDFKLEPLRKVINGQQRVRIHCHRADDIETAIRLSEEFGLDYTLEHATEGYKISKLLSDKKVTCVIGPLLLSHLKMEVWDLRQDTPAQLEKAGVNICLTADHSTDTAWLPTHVGIMIKKGLSIKTAFEAVTINPARVMKLEDRIGSLEVGKDADIAIFDGFPFSNMTNCIMTIIDGEVYKN